MAGRLGSHGPSAENLGQRGVRVRTDGDASNNLSKDHHTEGELLDSLLDVVKKTSRRHIRQDGEGFDLAPVRLLGLLLGRTNAVWCAFTDNRARIKHQ